MINNITGEKLERTSGLWDKVYDNFDPEKAGRSSVWNEKPTPFFIRYIDWLKYLGIESFGIIGCGDGRNIRPFLDSGFHVTAIDASNSAIKTCRELYLPNDNLTLIQGLLENTELNDNSLDALMCDHVLVHIENINEAFDEFYRIIKPNGFALIELTSPLDSTFGKGEKVSDNEFMQGDYYLRFDPMEEVYKHMERFKIVTITSEYSIDPDHGIGYVRKINERHEHHSYFILARKPK